MIFRRPNIFLIIAIFFLMFPAVFASDGNLSSEEKGSLKSELLIAISKDDVDGVESFLQAGADPREIEYFSNLPSIEVSDLLLNNGERSLGLNDYFYLVGGFHFTPLQLKASPKLEKRNNLIRRSVRAWGHDRIYLLRGVHITPSRLDWLETSPKLEERNNLIRHVVKKWGGANLLLEFAVNQYVNRGDNSFYIQVFGQEDLVRIALNNEVKFSDINIIGSYYLPSREVVDLMFKDQDDSVEPSQFLNFVFRADCYEYDPEIGGSKLNDDLVKRKYDYLNLAFEKGADLSSIHYYSFTPDLFYDEAIEIFLKHVSVNRLLVFILNVSCEKSYYEDGEYMYEVVEEIVEKRDKYIEFLLKKKGADPDLLLGLSVYMEVEEDGKSYHAHDLTRQESLIGLTLGNGAEFSNVEAVAFHELPSREAVNLMFKDPKNSIDPNDFLNSILAANCKKYDVEKGENVIKDELVELKKEYIGVAFDKGATLDSLYFLELPDVDTIEVLFNKGLDPDRFIDLLAQILLIKYSLREEKIEGSKSVSKESNHFFEIDKDLIRKRDALVEFAVKRGAKYRKIDGSLMIPVIELINAIERMGGGEIGFRKNVNLVNEDKKTLLILFAEVGNLGIIKSLVLLGADLNMRDKEKKSAIDYAKERGRNNVVRFFEDIMQKEARKQEAESDEL